MQHFRRRYVEPVGGIAWSIIPPLIMIATRWFCSLSGILGVKVGDGAISFHATLFMYRGGGVGFSFPTLNGQRGCSRG